MERRGDHPKYLPGTHEMQTSRSQIEEYEKRTGKKFKQDIIQIGFEAQKQISQAK